MHRFIPLAATAVLAGFVACSDDDGSNVVPNPPPGSGGGGAGGSSADAGPAGTGGRAGTGGGGRAGTGGAGAGGSAGCTPVSVPDAGLDAGNADAGLDASAEGPPNGVVSFEQDVHPIFAERCGPCHTADNTAGHNVGGPDVSAAYDDAVRLGQVLVSRVDGGGMPPLDAPPPNDCGAQNRGDQPGDPGCLTVAQVELIQTWIDQCYPR